MAADRGTVITQEPTRSKVEWEVASALWNHLDYYLSRGWEPFAVTAPPNSAPQVFFRRSHQVSE